MTQGPILPMQTFRLTLRRLGALAGVLVAFALPASAQDGKIAGRVTDRASGDPLPGVNVLVEGTQVGATTDVDGYYTILRVPAGPQTLVFSYLGYKRVRLEGVDVLVDRTATTNLALDEEAIAGEEVVVTAERPAVQRDLTATATGYSQEQIERAPVSGVRGVIALTAGVDTNPDGTLSVRGSGPYDLQVLVNGAAQTQTSSAVPGTPGEKANNSWKYDFNPLGVGQIEVISGGFSAEYGNAQSGIVKVATREGKERYEAEYRTEYRAPGQYHWGDYYFSPDQPEFQKWGSLGAWRSAFPDSSSRYHTRMYTLWMSNHLPTFTAPDTVYRPNGQILYTPGQRIDNRNGVYDYTDLAYTRHLFGVGGPLSADKDLLRFHLSGEVRDAPTRLPTIERTQRYRNVTLTTTLQPSGRHKFRLTNLFQYYLGGIQSGADDIRFAGRDPLWKYTLTQDSRREEQTATQTLNYTFAATDKSILEATASYTNEQYRVPMYPTTQRTDPWSIPAGAWDENFRVIFGLTSLFSQDARTRTASGNVAFTSQLRRTWELKAGAQLTRWSTVLNGVSSRLPNAFVAATGFADFYEATPTLGAAYVQNKLEYEGMVANLGLRVDGYNFGADVPADRFSPFYPAVGSEATGTPATVRSLTRLRVSPRLGFSFPIGDATAFRLQYGHFSAMPQSRVALSRTTNLGWSSYGNPNLKPERTISFEVGVQQALWQASHRLDVVGYYNDRSQQVSTVQVFAPSSSIRNPNGRLYTSFNNSGYATSFGVEVSFERLDRERWNYRFSYSLARTTIGSFGASAIYSDDPDDVRNARNRKSAADVLSGNDRTHRARALLGYSLSKREGLRVLGVYPFASADVNLIYSAQSGAPYTYATAFSQFKDVVNNRRYPFEESVDLSFTKAVLVQGYGVTFGARIQNLFDNQWLTPTNGVTVTQADLSNYITTGALLQGGTNDVYNYRNVPRQVFFSLGLRIR